MTTVRRSAWKRAAGGVAALVDNAFNDGVLAAPRRDLLDPERALAEVGALRDQMRVVHDRATHTDEGFFPHPGSLHPLRKPAKSIADAQVERLSWPSRPPRLFREQGAILDALPGNDRGVALYFRNSPAPRPLVLLIHGFGGGGRHIEPRVWPLSSIFAQGLDVLLPVLPAHGPRTNKRGAPAWPGRDVRLRAEGFRQAMWDLQGLIAWLRDEGHPFVGAMGMSLGGYTTGLLATVDRTLDFAAPMIPLASFPDWTRDVGHIGGTEEQVAAVHAALEDAHAPFSPLRRPLVVPKQRTFVAGAERDGVTPIAHAARMAEHFDVPLVTFGGGHLLQFGRGAAFKHLFGMLRSERIL